MLDIPSHYAVQYFLHRQEAAYRAQLHRSISEMLRHACAEERRRGRAARRSLRVRCGLLPQQGNDSSEISFHVPLPCVQMRISGGTSPNIGPVLSSTCPAAGPVHKRRRESQQNEKSRRATFRDKRWHRLLLLLLIGYRSLGQCIQLSFVEVVFIHVGEVKPDWITQPEKLLLLPLNPTGQGPTAVLSTVFSF